MAFSFSQTIAGDSDFAHDRGWCPSRIYQAYNPLFDHALM